MLRKFRGIPRKTYIGALLAGFGLIAVWAAIRPIDRQAWALENALVACVLALLFLTYRKLPLSRFSYGFIFVFLCLHEIGSHYTYEKVPYDRVLGFSINGALGWERNNYDRLIHFAYGLLLAYPIREIVLRVGDLKGFWGYFLPMDVTMSTSMLFELLEWGVAVVFGGSAGAAYLGVQGDVWDAHKDMVLASLGAAIAMGATAAINARFQRDFTREWIKSLKIKKRPLGEEELARQMTR
jgi:putative membrane protein